MGFPAGRVTPASTDMLHPLHSSGDTSNINKISISLQNSVQWVLFSRDGATVRTTADNPREKCPLDPAAE